MLLPLTLLHFIVPIPLDIFPVFKASQRLSFRYPTNMPRKAFVADLQGALTAFERNNITKLRAGEEDGMINFHYHCTNEAATEITILVPGVLPFFYACVINVLTEETVDLGEYPESHMYMFYTNSESVSPSVHSALDAMSDCMGLKVSEMLCKASRTLDKATAGSRHNPVDLDDGDPMDIDSDHGKSGTRQSCTMTVQ